MTKQLEFYFPKTKSKHMAYAKMGKQYPQREGLSYGVQQGKAYPSQKEAHKFV